MKSQFTFSSLDLLHCATTPGIQWDTAAVLPQLDLYRILNQEWNVSGEIWIIIKCSNIILEDYFYLKCRSTKMWIQMWPTDIFYWNGTKGDGRKLNEKMKTSLCQSLKSNEETELSMQVLSCCQHSENRLRPTETIQSSHLSAL